MAIGVRCCETCSHWDLAGAKVVTIPPRTTFKLAMCDLKLVKQVATFVCADWKQRV
jgi:hypothetical protein